MAGQGFGGATTQQTNEQQRGAQQPTMPRLGLGPQFPAQPAPAPAFSYLEPGRQPKGVPLIKPSSFANPSLGKEGGDAFRWLNPDGTPVVGSARDFAVAGATAAPRVAPRAVAPTLNLGLLGPGAAITAGGVGAVGAGLGLADQTRQQQGAQLSRLIGAAEGTVPSAAEQQMQRGLGQGLAQSLALAASARGGGGTGALAQRAAIDANADFAADVAQRTGELRAAEQATARGQVSELLGMGRGQDLQTAQLGLGLGGLGIQQQGVGLTAAQSQLGADQAVQLANLDAQLRQTGMDDQQRLGMLASALGIDTRTQEGAIALEQLLIDASLGAQDIRTQRKVGRDAANAQLVGGLLSGGSTVAAGALIGGGK